MNEIRKPNEAAFELLPLNPAAGYKLNPDSAKFRRDLAERGLEGVFILPRVQRWLQYYPADVILKTLDALIAKSASPKEWGDIFEGDEPLIDKEWNLIKSLYPTDETESSGVPVTKNGILGKFFSLLK